MRKTDREGRYYPTTDHWMTFRPLQTFDIWEVLGRMDAIITDQARRMGQYDYKHEAYWDGDCVVIDYGFMIHEDDLHPDETSTIH